MDSEGPKVEAHLACWRNRRREAGEVGHRSGGLWTCVRGVLLVALREWLLSTGTPSANGSMAAASSKSVFGAV